MGRKPQQWHSLGSAPRRTQDSECSHAPFCVKAAPRPFQSGTGPMAGAAPLLNVDARAASAPLASRGLPHGTVQAAAASQALGHSVARSRAPHAHCSHKRMRLLSTVAWTQARNRQQRYSASTCPHAEQPATNMCSWACANRQPI
jgi:hypothetical protein